MLFVTTHQQQLSGSFQLDSVPASRRASSARRSTQDHNAPHEGSGPSDSDSQHHGPPPPHQTTHSHSGAVPRSGTFSRPNSGSTVAGEPFDPEHGHARSHVEHSAPFSLGKGVRGGRRVEESSAEESSGEEEALVKPRRSSRRSSKGRR